MAALSRPSFMSNHTPEMSIVSSVKKRWNSSTHHAVVFGWLQSGKTVAPGHTTPV